MLGIGLKGRRAAAATVWPSVDFLPSKISYSFMQLQSIKIIMTVLSAFHIQFSSSLFIKEDFILQLSR